MESLKLSSILQIARLQLALERKALLYISLVFTGIMLFMAFYLKSDVEPSKLIRELRVFSYAIIGGLTIIMTRINIYITKTGIPSYYMLPRTMGEKFLATMLTNILYVVYNLVLFVSIFYGLVLFRYPLADVNSIFMDTVLPDLANQFMIAFSVILFLVPAFLAFSLYGARMFLFCLPLAAIFIVLAIFDVTRVWSLVFFGLAQVVVWPYLYFSSIRNESS